MKTLQLLIHRLIQFFFNLFHCSKSIWFLSHSDGGGYPYTGPSITTKSATNFHVEWGDGSTEDITTSSSPYSFYKAPDIEGERLLKIWGNVKNIKAICFGDLKVYNTPFLKVNLINASTIEDISFFYSVGFQSFMINKTSIKKFSSLYSDPPLKFSECVNLESIDYAGTELIDIQINNSLKNFRFDGNSDVLFGANPNLNSIQIADNMSSMVKQEKVNAFLVGLLANVVGSPRAGNFVLNSQNFSGPTNDGLQAAQTLKTSYNWTFFPDIQ